MTLENHVAESAGLDGYVHAGRQANRESLSPEFRLALACCRWPPSETRNAAVRAAAAIVDWDLAWQVAKRHRVIGFVYEALTQAETDIPPTIARKFAATFKRIVGRNLLLAGETVRLHRALESAGIVPLVLKGPTLAQLAYGSANIKQTRDIDLLVPPDRAEAALQIIERAGYALASPAQHLSPRQRRGLIRHAREVELLAPRRRCVELQWHAAYNPMLLRGVDASSPTQDVVLFAGASVRTLATDDLFAYLCVHGAHHAWSRLKWLADVNALIVTTQADIGRLYRHAQGIGAGLCAAQALLLCQNLFGLNLAPDLMADISANRRTKKLVAMAMTAMSAAKAETEMDGGVFGVMRVAQTQFLLGQGWAFYLAQIRAAVVGPSDVVRFPLPVALHFLYPILRIPLWLWRRAVAGQER